MTLTVEVFDQHALNLLKELEQMSIIRLIPNGEDVVVKRAKKRKVFNAVQLDTRGFKFNRDEANER